jgi:hypothetical protein
VDSAGKLLGGVLRERAAGALAELADTFDDLLTHLRRQETEHLLELIGVEVLLDDGDEGAQLGPGEGLALGLLAQACLDHGQGLGLRGNPEDLRPYSRLGLFLLSHVVVQDFIDQVGRRVFGC